MTGEPAARELELALAEQSRCSTRYQDSVGTSGEISAYARLRSASRRVADCTRVDAARHGLRQFEFAVSSGTAAPSQARHEVARRLRGWQAAHSVVETVELLTSETVTNAVTHGAQVDGEAVTVAGTLGINRFLLSVTNAGPPFDDAPELPPPTAAAGRGLFLVDALSSNWGRRHLAGLTGVWFEVAV